MKKLYLLVCLLGLWNATTAQFKAKKPLDHTVYDHWKSVQGDTLSPDGRWAAYSINPQEGDGNLILTSLESPQPLSIPRGTRVSITTDSRFAIFLIKPPFAAVRQARIKKKKPEEMPKDSLGIVRLGSSEVVKIPAVKSFEVPKKGNGQMIAYLVEKSLPDTSKAIKTPLSSPSIENNSKQSASKKEENTELILRNLATGQEFHFLRVTEYAFSKNGQTLIFTTTEKPKDTATIAGTYLVNTQTGQKTMLLAGKGTYKQVALDETGSQAAFLADRDTTKNRQRFYQLYYWNEKLKSAVVEADTATTGMPTHWTVSENSRPFFSKDGKKLFFGTAPIQAPVDTTLYDFEIAEVDVWNWQDGQLQSEQLKNKDKDLKKSYLAVTFPSEKQPHMVQLATEQVPYVKLTDENNSPVAIGFSDLAYQRLSSWEGFPRSDVYIVNIASGKRQKVLENIRAFVSLSPKGKYLSWYSSKDKNWFVYSLKTGQVINLTAALPTYFFEDDNDVPDDPQSYGWAGWTENDAHLIVYDKYDLWQLDPLNTVASKNLTQGGAAQNLRFRYVYTDPETKYLKPNQKWILTVFDRRTKSSGYASITPSENKKPVVHILDAYSYTTPLKAPQAETYLFRRTTFQEGPDLYTAGADFASRRKLTDINPQQKEYLWGTAELISWLSAEGKKLDGLLYKPENFDPKQQYPLLVYYYERSSDNLHRYSAPAPSASTINIPLFVSRGYVVFVPDIVYEDGLPGESAYDAVMTGTLKLIEQGFIDKNRMGLQGQSWGGYQTAYLITRTNLFRAAMAGAPVSNMTSAYGGIRWESGVSRMFQYEKDQSRIGGTLWEKPMAYIENSPLFHVPRIQTPLLIMHNDTDGAVPWYQGIELFVAMRRLNKPVWMVTYNKEAHNLVERRNRKDLSIRMSQFFDHYLKGEPEPVWMKQGVPATEKGKNWGLELTKEEKPQGAGAGVDKK